MRLFGIALAFAAGAAASNLALHALPSRFGIDLAQPIVVATEWGSDGVRFWCILACTLAVAFIFYIMQLRAPLSMTRTLLASGLALLAGLFWLPLLSSDVYAYAAYGEMVRVGLDPYVHHAANGNVLIANADWQWRPVPTPVCVYGPTFVAIARAIVTVMHGLGPLAVLESFRVVSCSALLLCGYLAGKLGGARAAAFVACNPVALWVAIEGHNDAIALAVILLGIIAFAHGRTLGAALVLIGVAVKLPLLTIARIAPGLAAHGQYHAYASVQALGIPIALVTLLFVLLRARAATTTADRWCTIALAAWVALPNPYPWYALWLLPPAAFARDRRVIATSLAVGAVAIARYLPDAVSLPEGFNAFALGAIALTAYAPLVL